MTLQPRGINREGLDTQFQAEEARKSALLIEARLQREQGQTESAALDFAEAAAIEERLAEQCDERRLQEKAVVHRFSAASCWAQAGNFYRALALCDELLAAPLSDAMRRRVQDYAHTLRARRAQWYDELLQEATLAEA